MDNIFFKEFPNENNYYDLPSFENADFSDVDMNMVVLRNGAYHNCTFDGAGITFADLVYAEFYSCTFRHTNMSVCKIGNATFSNCLFKNANLSYCSAENTDFSDSTFNNCKLDNMSLVSTNFTNTKILNSSVYAISSWDLILENATQKDLIITRVDDPVITVDDIELAQFIYLMINNSKLRNIIDAITSKVVLILGNFSPERKKILDNIRDELRHYNLIPVLYDFTKPISRDHTETVQTLANLSNFIIADLSSPKSIPQELTEIIPHMPSLNIYPLILEGETEYGMFEHLQRYSWVKPITIYSADDIKSILKKIVKEQNL